jgi:hypothetical protein
MTGIINGSRDPKPFYSLKFLKRRIVDSLDVKVSDTHGLWDGKRD